MRKNNGWEEIVPNDKTIALMEIATARRMISDLHQIESILRPVFGDSLDMGNTEALLCGVIQGNIIKVRAIDPEFFKDQKE